MKKYPLIGLVIVGLLVLTVPVILVAGKKPLSLFSRAEVPKTVNTSLKNSSVNKFVELAEQIQTGNPDLTTSTDAKLGISVSFNPGMWSEAVANSPGTLGGKTWELNQTYGFAKVDLSVFSNDYLNTLVAAEKNTGVDNSFTELDYLSRNFKTQWQRKHPGVIAVSEKIRFHDESAYKFNLAEEFLGKQAPFYVFLLISGNKYYQLTVKTTQLGLSQSLADDFLDQLAFLKGQTLGTTTSSPSTPVNYDPVQISELVKPSVVNVLQIYCDKITVTPGSIHMKPSYKFCSGTKGSGLLVSSSGYVATNGHVVKTYPEQAVIENLFNEDLKDFVIDFVREVSIIVNQKEISVPEAEAAIQLMVSNPTFVDAMYQSIYELLDRKLISLSEEGVKYFVRLGNDPFTFDENKIKKGEALMALTTSASVLEAKLLTYQFPNFFTADVILHNKKINGTDVALLALNNPDNISFPALKLGDADMLKEGMPLLILGYPGLVEGVAKGNSLLDYKSSSVKPTVTRGIVSGIKKDEGGRTLIQTDASIDHGNSGGPAFNEQGEVVGMATYGFISQSGNFNFLRDIKETKDLLSNQNVNLDNGEVYTAWKTGLENFWGDYYTHSIKNFNQVKLAYPIHPLVDDYITRANDGIKKGQDKGLLFGMEKELVLNGIYAGGAILGVLIVLGLIIVLLRRKKPPAVKYNPPGQVNPNYFPPPPPGYSYPGTVAGTPTAGQVAYQTPSAPTYIQSQTSPLTNPPAYPTTSQTGNYVAPPPQP